MAATTTSAEAERVAAELAETNRYAKRQQHILGTPDQPSKWDSAHGYLDALLDDYEAACAER